MRKYICLLIISASLLAIIQHDCSGNESELDNPAYKKWCIETFEYGEYVYEAYKKIAFDVKYTPEIYRTDDWKTPLETYKSKEGDCEDTALLFLDGLALSQRNAGVVWGWVVDRNIGTAKAHVWCELTARDGEKYVVESFSTDWKGIIPMKIIKQSEHRKPIFKLSCIEFSCLSNSYDEWDIQVDYNELFVIDGDYLTYGNKYITDNIILHQNPDSNTGAYNKKEVRNILNKLHELFARIHNGE